MKVLALCPTGLICFLIYGCHDQVAQTLIFEERNGLVAVEAEDFSAQTLNQIRSWYIMDPYYETGMMHDPDSNHFASASGQAYLEILPDTRTNLDEELIAGENFSNEPGILAVLHYEVYFHTPGRYFVWVRAYSTGSEDNGIHVGLDGEWVESGQRMQWCEGKDQWTWASKQRIETVHCGVQQQIFLDIPSTGIHTISFSMREDGFEFDKWVMNQVYRAPMGFGPEPAVYVVDKTE
ncbi:MAG: hypothetical protein OEQ53_10700 [Saprospiraceae bacterium]|nr:hypothetical protein [Saprospiraceae bacterium]